MAICSLSRLILGVSLIHSCLAGQAVKRADPEIERDVTTTTIYSTVRNSGTVTSTVSQCGQLPLCNQVSWNAVSTVSSTPSSFVLSGKNDLQNFYFSFDNAGKVLMSRMGSATLASLHLDDASGQLSNALNLVELIFLRYNSSVLETFPQEDTAVLDVLREVQYGEQDSIYSSDYLKTWFWDTANDEPLLRNEETVWHFYFAGQPSKKMARGNIFERDNNVAIYMLPASVTVGSDSPLQQLTLSAASASQFSSSAFSSIPISTSTAETITLPLTTDTGTAAPTNTDTDGPTNTDTGGPTNTDTAGPTDTDTSGPTTPTPSVDTVTVTTTTTTTSSSTAVGPVLNAYQVITSNSLQAFCTDLLSYYSQTTQLSSTIYTTTSTTTSIEVTTTTSYSGFITSIQTTITTSSPTSLRTRGLETVSELATFALSDILSGCSSAISSPTATFTTDIFISTMAITSVATTSISSVETPSATSTFTSASIIVVDYPGIGVLQLSDASDQTTTNNNQAYLEIIQNDLGTDLQNVWYMTLGIVNDINAGLVAMVQISPGNLWTIQQIPQLSTMNHYIWCFKPDGTDVGDQFAVYLEPALCTGDYAPIMFTFDNSTGGTQLVSADNAGTYADNPIYPYSCTYTTTSSTGSGITLTAVWYGQNLDTLPAGGDITALTCVPLSWNYYFRTIYTGVPPFRAFQH
ncbi:hypothetical protein TWF694_009285 [Orbilia ellipsospora]|uniref:Uncharacterized protein n=1 Tax=Orbilia ellipsospora TaxID=2528407 RepID=A0AAV9XFF9_9PEZI